MPAERSGAVTQRTVRTAAAVSAGCAVVALIVLSALGRPLSGGALAAGLLLGTTNGLIAARLIHLPVPFVASSLLRIVTLSMIGIAIGFALGLANIWLVILGLGAAQFVLAASALRQLVQR
jgi:hypothetical protein